MRNSPTLPDPLKALGLATGVSALIMLGGCSGGSALLGETSTQITPEAFRADAEHPAVRLAEAQAIPVIPQPLAADPGRVGNAPTIRVGGTPSGPELFAAPLAAVDDAITQTYLTEPGRPVANAEGDVVAATLLDAKVGDINGRPIYADDFFEPLADAFRAEAARLPEATWLEFVEETIGDSLDSIITDELLRAEALQRLTPAQQQGLRNFLQSFREELIGNNLGSEQLAIQNARDERGQSLSEVIKERREQVLISIEIRESIYQRVNVSWRDVQQRYERDFDRWNPDPVAMFRVIRVRTDETESIESIAAQIEAGDPFAQIASDPANGFNRDEGGGQQVTFTGEYAQASLFGPDALNSAAQRLQPSQHAGPIVIGSFTYWIGLEEVLNNQTSLYEAQLAIAGELENELRRAELDRFVARLVKRARVTNRDEIADRLFEIAVARYGPNS